ncbi:MAG: hypothetical protein ACYTG7_06355 [Planctomycetota bacterium]
MKKENTETPTVDILFVITEDAPIGFQNLKLRAEVDSERVRETNIHVTFNVLPPVSFMVDGKTAKDAIFDFGVLKAGQGAMKELEIINQNPEIPYDITEMSLNSRHEEFIESDLVTLEEGIRYKLTVRIKPEIDARFFRGVIKLISEHPDLKKKEIPLKGWISKD